jgi:hypothetical protein
MRRRECRAIEPLLYLMREGELDRGEAETVGRHVAGCGTCSALLRELRSMDGALERSRAALPEHPHAAAGVAAVMRATGGAEADSRRRAWRGESSGLVGWARTVFGTAAAVATLLLALQSVRDMVQLSALEAHLAVVKPGKDAALRDRLAIARSALQQASPPGVLEAPSAAGLAPDLRRLIASIGGIGGDRAEGWMSALADRYPALATVDPGDGLDPRERAILQTEGKALLEELEQLVNNGEEKP